MRSHQNGFTLLEVMIGITLLALVMTTVLIGLRVASRAYQQGEDRLKRVYIEEERADFMAKQVASLAPYKVRSTDPKLQGEFAILEARASCFRFLSTYGSHYRNRSGLILVEYGLVGAPGRNVGLFLRETPVQDDGELLHRVIQEVAADPESGKIVTTYRPFFRQGGDLGLRTDLDAARFEYLVPDSQTKEAHWVSEWLPVPEVPYPWAVRFLWEQDGHRGEVTFPIRAHTFLKS
jgi:prepilin-type N-terminal cleavage/methylation domain-containing protein